MNHTCHHGGLYKEVSSKVMAQQDHQYAQPQVQFMVIENQNERQLEQ